MNHPQRERSRTEGWGVPDNQNVWHYFADQTSLCRVWSYGGVLAEAPYLPANANCAACWHLAQVRGTP